MRIRFGIITLFLVFVIALCVRGSVQGQTEGKQREYYNTLEREYRAQIREILEQEGFEKSGVNMTWVSGAEGGRLYTVRIHHYGLTQMSRAGRDALVEQLMQCEFDLPLCTFVYEFT